MFWLTQAIQNNLEMNFDKELLRSCYKKNEEEHQEKVDH